ncbi:MAG: hypothetical protein IT196_05365 [Acidimicrobiales bacterium]|nr:hypothetical protein [Acidimicrobiales bacterium]
MASKTATIRAVVLGDVDNFKKGMKEVAQDAEETGDKVKRDLNQSFDDLGEGAGNAESKFIGLSDSISGTQDVMEGLRTGNVATLAMGLADLSGAVESLWSSVGKTITAWWGKVTATTADTAATTANTGATIGQRIASFAAATAAKAQAAAQWLLNAAMSANPIMLVVVAIGALVAGLVVAYRNVGWFRDAVDAVWAFVKDNLWPILVAVGDWLGTVFVAAWDVAKVAIGWVVDRAGDLWDTLAGTVWPLLQTVAGWLGDYFVLQWQVATTAIGWVIDRAGDLWDILSGTVWPILKELAAWLGDRFKAQWGVARDSIGWVIDKLQAMWAKAIEVKDGVTTALDTLVGFVSGLAGRIGSAASGMWDSIRSEFKGVVNSIIGWWNNLSFGMPSIDVPFGPDIPGFTISTPNIAYLAQGGLVRGGHGGTLAMIGEGRSDELVVPLDRAGRNGLGGITINVHAPVGANARTIGRELQRYLNEYGRAS